jgi:hypothetical protein
LPATFFPSFFPSSKNSAHELPLLPPFGGLLRNPALMGMVPRIADLRHQFRRAQGQILFFGELDKEPLSVSYLLS